jgi:hypothetical protein
MPIMRQPSSVKPKEGFLMGKVISITWVTRTWVTREDQLPRLMSGLYSILTGGNLVNLDEIPDGGDQT